MELLRCDGLKKTFDGTRAVAGVTLEFPAKCITAIIGPNGAGKTTLVNLLTGFIRPDDGRCFLGHLDITNIAPHRIAKLGLSRTFQDLRLSQQITALNNVMMARPDQRGEKLFYALFRLGMGVEETRNHDEALRLLDLVGLQAKANEFAGELSYGEQKLLTLACCLATEAGILLLDEPFSGIHTEVGIQIQELLRKLSQHGKSIIFIEHDISAVRRIADAVIVMDEGKVIAKGAPGEVLERPEIMEAYIG
jgi:ABC-type branched-subunit amino acid transport system ATPase component